MPIFGVQAPRVRNGHILAPKVLLMFGDRVEERERRPLRTPRLRVIRISDLSRIAVEPRRFRWDLIIESASGISIVVRGLPKGEAHEAQRRLEWLTTTRFPDSNKR